jgi:uncharacterized protein YcbK (DUF882 family)
MNRRRFLLSAAGLLSAPLYRASATPASGWFRLRLVDAHTGTTFDGIYRDAKGPIGRVMDELCIFLRDQHSGRMTSIDVGVIDFLANVMTATGQTSAIVLSAFRTQETNAMLARTTFGVAENSQHLYGRALDVRFATNLADAVAVARAMRRGGVGWYPHSGFFHLDSGPVRNWTLDGQGLDRLLLRLHEYLAHSGLSIAQRGEFLAGRPRRPLSVNQRLALHRVLAKAEFLARRH